MRYDVAIIGTGPAGVSAALTAKNRNLSILLLGSREMSEKVAKAHEIRNYPGLPSVRGEDLAKAFRNQLEEMEIPITETRIGAVYAMGDYFALQAGEEMPEAKTVILATGVVMAKPLPGEDHLPQDRTVDTGRSAAGKLHHRRPADGGKGRRDSL